MILFRSIQHIEGYYLILTIDRVYSQPSWWRHKSPGMWMLSLTNQAALTNSISTEEASLQLWFWDEFSIIVPSLLNLSETSIGLSPWLLLCFITLNHYHHLQTWCGVTKAPFINCIYCWSFVLAKVAIKYIYICATEYECNSIIELHSYSVAQM